MTVEEMAARYGVNEKTTQQIEEAAKKQLDRYNQLDNTDEQRNETYAQLRNYDNTMFAHIALEIAHIRDCPATRAVCECAFANLV